MEENTISTNTEIEKEAKKLGAEKENFSESFPILIIDDDSWIQRILSHHLQDWGFKTYTALDAFEGLAFAIKHKPLLILLDIVMPELNGDVLLKMLKKIEITSNIPTLIISSNLNRDLLGETYKSGAAGFISKPFSQQILFEKIRDCLDPLILNKMKSDVKPLSSIKEIADGNEKKEVPKQKETQE